MPIESEDTKKEKPVHPKWNVRRRHRRNLQIIWNQKL